MCLTFYYSLNLMQLHNESIELNMLYCALTARLSSTNSVPLARLICNAGLLYLIE